MNSKKQEQAIKSKRNILDNAIELFAENGFAATNVESIATKAGIPKSLIYYHYKSKDVLLDSILENFITDSIKIFRTFNWTGSDDDYSQMVDFYIEFMEKNKNVVKIFFMESLKSGKNSNLMIKISDFIYGNPFINGPNITPEQRKYLKFIDFFTFTIPIAAFSVFGQEWGALHDVKINDLKHYLITVLKK
ncbi:MAG: TetR/AcrR family transcriptional regulator [Spirochaetales bacterium]|nr:TetR/AcrR family transcriptional regulator [Spirochaetales bacterium]